MRNALHIAALAALAAWLGAVVEATVVLVCGSGPIGQPLAVGAFVLALGTPAHVVLQVVLLLLLLGLRTDERVCGTVRSTIAGLRGNPAAATEILVTSTRGALLCGLFAVGLAIAGPVAADSIVTPSTRRVAIGALGLIILLSAFVVARALGPAVEWAIRKAGAGLRGSTVSLVRGQALAVVSAAAAVAWLLARAAPRESMEAAGTMTGALAGLGLIQLCLRRRRLPPWLAPPLLLTIGLAALLAPGAHAARAEAISRVPSVRASQVLIGGWTELVVGGDRSRVMAPSWVDLPRGARAPKHVVLLSIDALRADRLGCHGYRNRPTSPFIDDLAKRAALFEDAHTPATTSLRSIPSVFLSRYPHTLPWLLYRSGRVMPDPAKTRSMAEILRDAGFRTVAVLHSRYLRNDGLLQGFGEVISDPAGMETREYTTKLRAERFVDRAIETLDDDPLGDRRLFLWMHFIEPHEPYNRVPGLDWGDQPSQRYDAEIRYVDTQLARFLAYLERRRIAQDSLFVLFSDHGEEFGEKGAWFHGRSLHRIATHVPLLFWGRGVRAGRHRGTVGLIDIMPTVLNLLSLRGRNLHGASLAASLVAGSDPPARTVVSALFRTRVAPPTAWSAERSGWKLLLGSSREPLELYRTRRDPSERHNAIRSQPEIREALRRDVAVVTELH